MKIGNADRDKLIKTLCYVLVWAFIIIGIGNTLGKQPVRDPTVVKSSTEVRQSIENSNISNTAKEQKLAELNLQAVIKGMKSSETVLGIGEWEKPVSKARDGIPALQIYFPQRQSFDGWHESFVLRSFVNITLPNPYPAVYEVYAEWLAMQLPDIQLATSQDNTGVYFTGVSQSKGISITGKVYSGAVKEAIHISQYAVKNTEPDAQDKIAQWKANFSKVKP